MSYNILLISLSSNFIGDENAESLGGFILGEPEAEFLTTTTLFSKIGYNIFRLPVSRIFCQLPGVL